MLTEARMEFCPYSSNCATRGCTVFMGKARTSPAPAAEREPSTIKQSGQARRTLLVEGTWKVRPLHLPASGVLLPPSQPKPSASLLLLQLHCPCSLFLCPCQNPALFLLPFFSSSGNASAPPQGVGTDGREVAWTRGASLGG